MPPMMTAEPISPPTRTAEALLERMLTLIRESSEIQDLTAARVRRAFEVDFVSDEGRLGFGERLNRDWWSSIELDPDGPYGPSLELAFRPDRSGTYPPATDICGFDYARLSAELVAMGFEHETSYGEHGRIVHESFERAGLSLTVHTRGEADEPPAKIAHTCVLRVIVN
jgi:hypothetical protein